MSERKYADLWKELTDEAGEDEIDRAASVSVAEAEADLKAAGFDVAAERAKAGAFLDAMASGASSSKSEEAAPRVAEASRRKGTRPAVLWLAAAATFVLAGGALYATLQSPPPVSHPPPPEPSTPAPSVPSADDLRVAAELRRTAAAACDAKQWSVCLADLDKARAVDPGGDDASTVKSLRDKAIAGILEPPEAPPPRK
jgi:hypothetical protein